MLKGLSNILIYILFPTIFTSLFTINIKSKEYIIYMFISYTLLTLYFIIVYKDTILKSIKNFNKKNLILTITYWIIGFSLMLLFNYIINYIILPNGISNNELSNRELLFNNKILYSIMLCILTPIIEEISFRLEFKKNIKNKYIFIFLTATIFALPHLLSNTKIIELLYFIPYFILGLTFSTIYYKTDNILSSILAHIIHNTINVLIILLF
ncbi:MAG: CPBP family intramembrane metalloprotease [Bacilli bacterium]|nr:CPBP family intramembrane metalloprotease [Bacilli bacterium]